MKNIKIKSLALENFKAFRNESFNFDMPLVEIYGRNESGKTTLADAIIWCLFSKDHLFRTQFAIKTHDRKGIVIPHLDHSVTMEIDVDGITHTLKRSLKEKWTKPRGQAETVFSGNYQECFVDGELLTVVDYAGFINSIVPEDVFKAITSPTYFLALPWQDKRTFLSSLVEEITEDNITGGDPVFNPLLEILKQQSLEQYVKHLKFQIKELKKEIQKIPVRLAEQNKALPEKQDWDDVEEKLKNKQKELDTLVEQQKIDSTLSPEEKERKRINDEILRLEKVKLERQAIVQQLYKNKVEEQQRRYNEADAKMRTNNIEIASYILPRSKCKSDIAEANAVLEKCRVDTLRVRREWAETQSRVFALPENINICAECGGLLSEEQVNAKRKALLEEFNANKAETFKRLKDEAANIKSQKDKAELSIANANKKIEDIVNRKSVLEEENKSLARVKSYPQEVYTDLLMNDEEFSSAEASICQLKLELEESKEAKRKTPRQDSDNEQKKVKEKEQLLRSEITSLTCTLAAKVQYNRISEIISDINAENKRLAQQLADLEKAEDIAADYSSRADNIFEERINRLFALVKWKLFRTNINGTQEPCCECTVKGTEANNGLNSAAYIMAGVDICNVISEYYNVSAPVIIDNAESINPENFLASHGQQIRLYVSNFKTLCIKKPNNL